MSLHAEYLTSLGASTAAAMDDAALVRLLLHGLTRGDRPRWIVLTTSAGMPARMARHLLRSVDLDPDETALPPTQDGAP